MDYLKEKAKIVWSEYSMKFLFRLNYIFLFALFALTTNHIQATKKSTADDVRSAVSFFRQGNYEKARKISEKVIAREDTIPKKILIVAILTAKGIRIADGYLMTYFKSEGKFDEELSKSVLFFLERAFVIEEYSLGLKWGYLFRKKAHPYPEYPKGLYYYSCILKDSGKSKDSLYVTSLALSRSTSVSLNEKIKLLRLHLLKEKRPQKEIKEFLENYPESEYKEEIVSISEKEKDSSDDYVMR